MRSAVPPPPPPRPPGSQRGRAVRELLGLLTVPQVVCWQVAVVAVLFALGRPWPVLVGTCVAAALLLAATSVRVGGRWLYELGVLGLGHLSRERRRDLPESAGKTPALLDLLLPGATVRTTATGQGPAMTVSHPGGLAAPLRLTDDRADPVRGLPLPAALLPSTEGQEFGVQVVLHAGVRRAGPPKVWLAVHAARTVEIPRDADLALVLRNAVRRVRRAARRAGAPVEVLPEEQAFAALAGLAHVTGGRTEVREDWRFWRTGPVCQAVLRLEGADLLTEEETRRLVAALFATTAGAATTVTLGARTGRATAAPSLVVRVAATTESAVADAATAARALLSTPAAPPGARLVRLDGAHSRGVAASLPIGAFLP
ncbi:hypothetical protein BJP25_07315 [Actinokineospora bangkokensis]|uniref:Type VII secretion protein EccE n=1 Tax=Actinokineospora bangkokensis TaxID=1193682 RepID=A0A1Q9LTE6_9PSEU|nr:hypothetical protein BJP25_07315 [Actinokineospora bangkokensis]